MVSRFASGLMMAVLLLAGCGGGGGSSAESLSIALSPSPLIASFYQGQLPGQLTVNAIASGNTSASTIYVVIVDAAGTFSPGPTTITQTGANTYSVPLRTAADLSVGSHPGTLQTRVCSDPLCQSVLTTASLPYNITVMAPAVGFVTPSNLVTAAVQGGLVSLQANITGVPAGTTPYVIARDNGEAFMVDSPIALQRAAGDSTYDFQIPTQATASDTALSGVLGLQFCSDVACQVSYGSVSVPYRVQMLSILAGSLGTRGNTDGPAAAALFSGPSSITVDGPGNVFLVDLGNDVIREIATDGHVNTFPQNSSRPNSVATNAAGTLYFSEGTSTGDSYIKRRGPDGYPTTFAVTSDLYRGFGAVIAADDANQVFSIYTDFRPSVPEGVVYRFANDGTRSELLRGSPLGSPRGLATDPAGNIYVSSTSPSRIVKIASDGSVTTLDTGDAQPTSLAVDGTGVVFALDGAGNRLVRIEPSGASSVLIPDNVKVSDQFKLDLTGVTVSSDGQLFISCYGNAVVLRTKLSPAN